MADDWLSRFFRARTIAKEGESVPFRGKVDFRGALVQVEDDADADTTRVDIGALASGGSGVASGSFLLVEDGEIVIRSLSPAELGIDFSPVSWAINRGASQGDGTYLVARGEGAGELVGTFTRSGAVVPTSIEVADVFANGAVKSAGSDWEFDGAFATGSVGWGVTMNGTDAADDPTWTSTAVARVGILAAEARSFSIIATSHVYAGATDFEDLGERFPDPTGFYAYANPGGGNQAGVLAVLSRSRDVGEVSVTAADEYLWLAMPDRDQYTAGGVTIARTDAGDAIALVDMGTLEIVRNGVTRVYRAWRSSTTLSESVEFTLS